MIASAISTPLVNALRSFEDKLESYEKSRLLWITAPEQALDQCEYDEDELDELICETQASITLLRSDIRKLEEQQHEIPALERQELLPEIHISDGTTLPFSS